MIQKIIFIIIGILLFLILNNYDTFNIGAPWIIVTDDINQNKLNGEEFSSTLNGPNLEESHFDKFRHAVDVINQHRSDGNPLTNPAIYHIVKNTNPGYFRVDLEKCQNPHNKISGNLEPGSGLSTADREWRNKTRNNIETKPLLPRKNLNFEQWEELEAPTAEEIEDLTESRLYSLGDSISYSCDTTKTQSKTSHELVCKPRRKFVLNAHGIIRPDAMYSEGMGGKTSIPQLLQLKLYKPSTDTTEQCLSMNNIEQLFYADFLILNTDITPTDIFPPDREDFNEILVQKNKSYLALFDENKRYENGILEELVYGEMTQLNTGRLYLHTEMSFLTDIENLTCFNIDNDDDVYCFYSELKFMGMEALRTNLVSLLNPFMVKPTILLDNENITSFDILTLTQYNNFHEELSRKWGDIVFAREIFPNGIHSNDLSIIILERKQFESPHTPENPWDIDNISDTDKLNTICSFASSRQSNKYPPDTENIFKNDNGQTKPVYYLKCNVTYDQNLVNYLRDSVKSLLQSCSVSIDPELLSSGFKRDSVIFNRLFPQQTSRSFPLLYFDIYTIDGFVHKSGTGYELDEQVGEYTSEDLRDLVTEIISQIYNGADMDGDDDPAFAWMVKEDYGYYQLFKKKMMLEKGLNESECKRELKKLYGRLSVGIFQKDTRKYLENGTYLCKNLLQEVWGNYGYDYNQENNGYECYNFIADIPIIFIKLFKTQLGESVDFHLLCCISEETTDIRTIQKNGYWGCEDNIGWSEPAAGNIRNTCDFYNRGNSIEKCTDYGHMHGANDNCCICKMVKNINERERQDGKPNIGPECKVRECKQTLEEKNEELRNDYPEDNMGITPEDWTTTNTWPEYMPVGRREGPGIRRNEPRKMEHIETAYRYINYENYLGDVDYGKIKKIESEGCAGVLKESEPITVKCNHTQLDTTTEDALYTNINAGDIKCDTADGNPNSDIAYYSGDLNCPRNLCSAMTIDTYFDMPLGEGEGGGGSLGSGAASASSCG